MKKHPVISLYILYALFAVAYVYVTFMWICSSERGLNTTCVGQWNYLGDVASLPLILPLTIVQFAIGGTGPDEGTFLFVSMLAPVVGWLLLGILVVPAVYMMYKKFFK